MTGDHSAGSTAGASPVNLRLDDGDVAKTKIKQLEVSGGVPAGREAPA
jgi:hypothetical protein